MIEFVYVLAIFIAALINITALTLLTLRFIPFPATARASGLLVICLGLFSLEHLVGLGRLYPLCLPLTALSAYIIWHDRARFLDETLKASEIVFLCAVLYGLVWRLSSPDIVEDNDRLSDFHLVTNYLSGERLPPSTTGSLIRGSTTTTHSSTTLLRCLVGCSAWGPGRVSTWRPSSSPHLSCH